MLVRYPFARKEAVNEAGELIARLCFSGKRSITLKYLRSPTRSRLWIHIVGKTRNADSKAAKARKPSWYIDAFRGIKRIFNA